MDWSRDRGWSNDRAGVGVADEVTKHPAKFNDKILDAIASLLPDDELDILDPFAGVGRVHELMTRNEKWFTFGIELEKEWARVHHRTIKGNALDIHWEIGMFDAIVTSPCYGNRMADVYVGPPNRVSHTYRLYLGHDLSPGSSAGLQWGEKYKIFHRLAWAEATRIVKPDGLFVLNIKDHYRASKLMPVTRFHARTLTQLGWKEQKRVEVDTPGQRHGQNHEARVEFESVILFHREVTF
jgi:hypothetical protein